MQLEKLTTGELVRQLGSEFVSFDDKTQILLELQKRDNEPTFELRKPSQAA